MFFLLVQATKTLLLPPTLVFASTYFLLVRTLQLSLPLRLELTEALLLVLRLLLPLFFVKTLPQFGFLDLMRPLLLFVAVLARVLRLELLMVTVLVEGRLAYVLVGALR